MKANSFDFGIIGAGIVGLSLAYELQKTFPEASIAIFEKEPEIGLHASGRNSGVIHAGFYYSPDSLKAQLTKKGNEMLHKFCADNDIPVNQCGKVVVAQNDSELDSLKILHSRAIANGVETKIISQQELAEIEPLAKTHVSALWSPSTSVSDPVLVTKKLAEVVKNLGITLFLKSPVHEVKQHKIVSGNDSFNIGHIINSAGLYADKIAKPFGFSDEYKILPFKGIYRYGNWKPGRLKRHIYPVPDSRNPFLGVHLTVTISGKVKIGPTAIPILTRENYQFFKNLKLDEIIEILSVYPHFLNSSNHDALGLIRTELPKYSHRFLARHAKKLSPSVRATDFKVKGTPGIRAQLYDTTRNKLEMDFVFRGDENSTHILNSVSPAWTSSLAISQYVVKDIKSRIE